MLGTLRPIEIKAKMLTVSLKKVQLFAHNVHNAAQKAPSTQFLLGQIKV